MSSGLGGRIREPSVGGWMGGAFLARAVEMLTTENSVREDGLQGCCYQPRTGVLEVSAEAACVCTSEEADLWRPPFCVGRRTDSSGEGSQNRMDKRAELKLVAINVQWALFGLLEWSKWHPLLLLVSNPNPALL